MVILSGFLTEIITCKIFKCMRKMFSFIKNSKHLVLLNAVRVKGS